MRDGIVWRFMFERFTETARKTLFFARYETTALGGASIDAEHMLLGLLRADRGPTIHWFAVADLSYSGARAEIRAHFGERPRIPTHEEIPFSDETERVLRYATEEADRAGHRDIDAEHLLLGVLREDETFAAGLLKRHGMALDDLRERILKPPAGPDRAPAPPAAGGPVSISGEAFDAVASVERLRWLIDELAQAPRQVDETRGLIDEIHHRLDALKRHVA